METEEAALTLAGLGVLYADWQSDLVRILALRFGLSPEDAADLTQETFLQACQALSSGPPVRAANVRGWLYRIATRKAIDAWRHRNVVLFAPLDDALALPIPTDATAEVVDRLEATALLEAMSPAQRRAIWRVYAGYPQTDVALKQHLCRARKLARKLREGAA